MNSQSFITKVQFSGKAGFSSQFKMLLVQNQLAGRGRGGGNCNSCCGSKYYGSNLELSTKSLYLFYYRYLFIYLSISIIYLSIYQYFYLLVCPILKVLQVQVLRYNLSIYQNNLLLKHSLRFINPIPTVQPFYFLIVILIHSI